MRLMDTDVFLDDESEAYMLAQLKVTDEATRLVNEVVHKKVRLLVKNAPTVDAAPVVHGEWIAKEEPFGWEEVSCAECSNCGEDFVLDDWGIDDLKGCFNYCPNCGAKMDGGKEDG